MDTGFSKAASLTHVHLLSIINTELGCFPDGLTVRILDAGCGAGVLISYLAKNLPVLRPALTFEIYGFDVGDYHNNMGSHMSMAIPNLREADPSIAWENRISMINIADPWPYSDGFFDIVLSNHVLEHVDNHPAFFSEICRTLRPGGFSVHLFPLVNCIYEGHLKLLFSHRIRNHDLLISYITLMQALGLGAKRRELSREEDARQSADYQRFYTNYLSYDEVTRLVKSNRLRMSFKYTREFYTTKLRSLFSPGNRYLYAQNRSRVLDWFMLMVLRYVSSVTLFLEKPSL